MILSSPFIAAIGLFAGLLFALIAAMIGWRRKAEGKLLLQRVRVLQQKIETALDDENFDNQRAVFGKALQSASLTTDLQRPRLETLAKIEKQPPEKYRILNQLAAQGLNVDEIAAVLGVSSVEANQLLNLSSVARMRR
jgi:DNA-directed RNA polymerase specialized sigma24 family protein